MDMTIIDDLMRVVAVRSLSIRTPLVFDGPTTVEEE
jgi:hypothetical protein